MLTKHYLSIGHLCYIILTQVSVSHSLILLPIDIILATPNSFSEGNKHLEITRVPQAQNSACWQNISETITGLIIRASNHSTCNGTINCTMSSSATSVTYQCATGKRENSSPGSLLYYNLAYTPTAQNGYLYLDINVSINSSLILCSQAKPKVLPYSSTGKRLISCVIYVHVVYVSTYTCWFTKSIKSQFIVTCTAIDNSCDNELLSCMGVKRSQPTNFCKSD